jgi:hypothetical protein
VANITMVSVGFCVCLEKGRSDQSVRADWERTSLKPYVDMLERHAIGLMEEVRRSKMEKIGVLTPRFSFLAQD